MVERMDIMVDDMTYMNETFEENVFPYDDTMIDNEGMSNNMMLGLVIGGSVIVGIVLGVILGRRAARK